jgi:hypothetical protein
VTLIDWTGLVEQTRLPSILQQLQYDVALCRHELDYGDVALWRPW